MDFYLPDSQHHRRGRNAQGRVNDLQGAPAPGMGPTFLPGKNGLSYPVLPPPTRE